MEFLLDNPLAAMEGPLFLLFYGIVAAGSIAALAVLKSQADTTRKLPTPSIPPQIDPFEIAYLRGGGNEMSRAVVFSLVKKGLIEIVTEGSQSEIKRSAAVPAGQPPLGELERRALNWFYTARQPKDVFEPHGGLAADLENFAEQYRVSLEDRGMLIGSSIENKYRPVKWAIVLGLGGLALYKITAALLNGYSSVFFLVLLGIFSVLTAARVGKLPRLTNYGKSYLERLQTAFDDLKYQSQSPYIQTNSLVAPARTAPQATFMGVDPLLLSVGVFGGGILAGTVFDNYNQAFHRAQQQSAGGSGCGSSCGSCSSSGSGGDGGSGCSSGCGGCGGGCS